MRRRGWQEGLFMPQSCLSNNLPLPAQHMIFSRPVNDIHLIKIILKISNSQINDN